MEGSRSTGGNASRKASDRMRKVMDDSAVECRMIADRLDFPFFHLTFRTVVPPGLPLQVFVDGGPDGFRDLYDSELGFANDPVLKKAMTSIVPFVLSDAIDEDDRETVALMRHCHRLGINDGLVVPLHGPRASHGMLSLLGPGPMSASPQQRETLAQQAQWPALKMFNQMTAAVGTAHQGNARKQLTQRQQEALRLAADGKVLSEIATALKVHPSTARYLVARAADKLGVETRIEAIVRMSALGDFFHGLHPGRLTESLLYFAAPGRGGQKG